MMQLRGRGLGLAVLVATLWAATPTRAQLLTDIVDREVSVGRPRVDVAGKTARFAVESIDLAGQFTGVALELRSDASDLAVTVRFETYGVWSDSYPMHTVRSATTDAVVAGWRSDEVRTAGRLEVTVTVEAEARLAFGSLGVFDNRSDTDRQPRVVIEPGALAPLSGAARGAITPPPLITRSEWGAKSFIGTPVPLANPTYDYMTFHHAAGYTASSREEGLVQMRAIQDLHQNVRGWSDIGYQFVIDRAGNLYQGRPFLTAAASLDDLPVLALGAHAGGANTGNVGICLLGCYHPPEGSRCADEITPEAYETYVTLFAFLSERYGVPAQAIRGHRDFGQTACPGDNNYALLPVIRTDVAELLITGNAALGEAELAYTIDPSGVVRLTTTLLADYGITGYRLERWTDDRRTVLYEGTGAIPGAFSDDGLVQTGTHEYRLYAFGENGRRQLLSRVTVDFVTPGAYVLTEAFPNPSSGDVRIRFHVRDRARVQLSVYDGLGRRVASLVDGFTDEEEWHTVTWPVSGVAPGVYRYRMRVEGFSGIVYDRSWPVVVVR